MSLPPFPELPNLNFGGLPDLQGAWLNIANLGNRFANAVTPQQVLSNAADNVNARVGASWQSIAKTLGLGAAIGGTAMAVLKPTDVNYAPGGIIQTDPNKNNPFDLTGMISSLLPFLLIFMLLKNGGLFGGAGTQYLTTTSTTPSVF